MPGAPPIITSLLHFVGLDSRLLCLPVEKSLVQLDGVQVQKVQCRSLSLANFVLNEIDTANVM